MVEDESDDLDVLERSIVNEMANDLNFGLDDLVEVQYEL